MKTTERNNLNTNNIKNKFAANLEFAANPLSSLQTLSVLC
jgi:hypothetical protein